MAASVTYTTWGGEVIKENRGGTKRGYVPDTLGSTAALVDDAGEITDEWTYWPYGEVASHKGDSTTPFTFVGTLGYFKDAVSSLTYVRARFYQAFTGQWMTRDLIWPIVAPYSYCRGCATYCVDPSGLLFAMLMPSKRMIDAVVTVGKGIIQSVGDTIVEFADAFVDAVTDTWNDIKDFFSNIPPVYGCYCGPQSGRFGYSGAVRPDPMDDVDKCCRDHDDDWAKHGCNAWNQFFIWQCRMDTLSLCRCLRNAECHTVECYFFRDYIAKVYSCVAWLL